MTSRLALLLLVLVLLTPTGAAQGIEVLSNGAGFHPVTESGRVIWTEGNTPTTLTLHLWDGQNTAELDQGVAGAFPGWPDLDASGRVAYIKVVGGRYELMLWDGIRTTQLTHSDIPGSDIDLGAPFDDLQGGFPRIAYGDVVFSSARGDVFLYDATDLRIRPISSGAAQRALQTTPEDREVMQFTGVKPVFHFDGRFIAWMHRASGEQTSEFTVYQVDLDRGTTPEAIAQFTAATPQGGNALVAGAAFDPFFVACGREIAWMYRVPGTGEVPDLPPQYAQYAAAFNETAIGYFDGSGASEVARGDLLPLNLALSDGHLAWIEVIEGNDSNRLANDARQIMSRRDGRTAILTTVQAPPMQAAAGSKSWSSPSGLYASGEEILWFEDEAECQRIALPGAPNGCAWMPTRRLGLFTRTSGENPSRAFRQGDLLLGGRLDAGRYVWRDDQNRIGTTILIDGLGGDSGLLQLADLMRSGRVPLGPDAPRTVLVDAFSLRAARGGGECAPGGASGGSATLAALTFVLNAAKGVLPDLDDIAALRLFVDVNKNGKKDAGDRLVGEATGLGERQKLELDTPIPISPGTAVHFLVEMEMKDADELCPCNEYTVSLAGADVEAGEVSVQGATSGVLALPNVTFDPIWGDGQAALPTTRLTDPLGFRVEDLPARCVESARFRFVNRSAGDTGVLHASDEEGTDLEVDLTETEDGLEAEIDLTLGSREGAYTVEASLIYPEETTCEPPSYTFVAHAGSFVLQVVDANDPAFVDDAPGPSHADYDTRTVSLTDDLTRLASGGEIRTGTTADGLSPLILRARLLGLTEAPEGEVTFTMEAADNSGVLTAGLGEAIPAETGTGSVSAEWVMTDQGPIAVALYTPPLALTPSTATERVVMVTATYQMPNSTEPQEETRQIVVYRPPVLLTHGMWSGPEAWSEMYTGSDPRFEVYVADYASRSAENFDALGGVMRAEIQRVRDDINARGRAVTQVGVAAHSMGGLIARQYIGENRGAGYRRADTFGEGDIYTLVTVGTPHYGSPIAWLTTTLRDPQYNTFSQQFIDAANAFGLDIWSGAVDAMCPGSTALRALGRTHVPAHTVRAWYFDSQSENDTWGFLVGFLDGIIEGVATGEPPTPLALLKYSLEFGAELTVESGLHGLYGAEKTDYLVTLPSQGGGITQGYRIVYPNTMHSEAPNVADGETTSDEIAARIFAVLAQSPDVIETFARSLPPPIVETDYITCN